MEVLHGKTAYKRRPGFSASFMTPGPQRALTPRILSPPPNEGTSTGGRVTSPH